MNRKPALDLTVTWFVWNLLLSLFSLWGAMRMVEHLSALIHVYGLRGAICTSPDVTYGACGPSALWTGLFIFSKVPELGDTFFLVFGKRKILFLHWYHHVSVLLFTWHAYSTRSGAGIWFITMNYTVHAFMYCYYASRSLSSMLRRCTKKQEITAIDKCGRSTAPLITLMQISQMFVGIWVLVKNYHYGNREDSEICCNSRLNALAGTLMYASYAFLFIIFAFRRYCCSTAKVRGVHYPSRSKED